MNGENILIDTNIALYLLSGDKTIAEILDGRDVFVSFITELELLGYQGISKEEQTNVRNFLSECIIVGLNESIKELTVTMKQEQRIKLPDAIIAATSIYMNLPLLTADSDFTKIENLNLIKYEK